MTNNYGAAGTGGINPDAAVAFLDAWRVPGTIDGRRRKTLNGKVVGPNDARTIRRWRSESRSINPSVFDSFLERYGLTPTQFLRWCRKHGFEAQGHRPWSGVLRRV